MLFSVRFAFQNSSYGSSAIHLLECLFFFLSQCNVIPLVINSFCSFQHSISSWCMREGDRARTSTRLLDDYTSLLSAIIQWLPLQLPSSNRSFLSLLTVTVSSHSSCFPFNADQQYRPLSSGTMNACPICSFPSISIIALCGFLFAAKQWKTKRTRARSCAHTSQLLYIWSDGILVLAN